MTCRYRLVEGFYERKKRMPPCFSLFIDSLSFSFLSDGDVTKHYFNLRSMPNADFQFCRRRCSRGSRRRVDPVVLMDPISHTPWSLTLMTTTIAIEDVRR
ncbi:unnamed protein product, partial [Arabidopsis halleri]